MAKIPRSAKGTRPSGVQTTAVDTAPDVSLLQAAADVLGTLADVTTKSEQAAARRLRASLEAKQAIVNEVDANVRSGDYEEGLRGLSSDLKAQHFDDPLKAAPDLLKQARTNTAAAVKAAPNSVIGLKVARAAAARTRTAMNDIHTWAAARQTQQAKNNVSVLMNQATRGAESMLSLPGLTAYIKAKEQELKVPFQNIHGKNAGDKMQEMKTGAVRAWALSRSDTDPLTVMNALDAKRGPLVDNLDATQRETLRNSAKASFEGLEKRREMDTIRRGVSQNSEIYEAFIHGNLKGGKILATKREIEERLKALASDPTISKKNRLAVQKTLKSREKFIDAIESVRRRQNSFDAEDDVGTVTKLYQQHNALFVENAGEAGKDLTAWLKQQERLAIAYSDEKISGGTFNTLMKAMSLALPTAQEFESENVGYGVELLGFSYRSPQQVGNLVLNEQFETSSFINLPPDVKNSVRRRYLRLFIDGSEKGQTVSAVEARKMAFRALSLESGQYIPGLE